MTRNGLGRMDQPDFAVNAAALHAELARTVRGEVRFDRINRALYATDASVYQIVPLGVVLPEHEADVAAVVHLCTQHSVPLTARGGGTSQAGQSIGTGVILDCSKHLNNVVEVNANERWVRAQPGCVLDELNLQLRAHGLHFAPDISTSNRATIGGMIANNSSGARSVIYGKTIDHVVELKVILSDGKARWFGPLDAAGLQAKCAQEDLEGLCYRTVRRLGEAHAEEIDRRFPKILRRVGGYNLDRFAPAYLVSNPFNLAHALVGSEGTLGVVVEAKLRLSELPRAKAVLVIQFAELLDALGATPLILEHHPAAVEVIDRYVLESTRLNSEAARLRDFLAGDPGAILIVELYGETPAQLPPRLDALESALRAHQYGNHFHRATAPEAQARIWALRRMALGLSMAEKGDAKAISFVEDSAVAPEHLRDYIGRFLQIVARHGTTAGVYAHASVGCLHVRPVIDLKTEEGIRRFESIAAQVSDLVLEYGGAFSGEHGDGLVRSPFQEKMFGPILYQGFRELKRTFDPAGIFNPGKIVDAPPLATNLRFGSRYVTPDVATTFDFSADGGIARSAELCAGVGECRKRREGIMCPSYRATRDEMHSTRGRANALRLAITGQLGLAGLADRALHEVLDLCLECKACKSECPTNVDMARLKAEFLHQYSKRHGRSLRSTFFGNVAQVSAAGVALAPLASRVARSRIVRWWNEKLLGIDRRRMPPAFARKSFTSMVAEARLAGRADWFERPWLEGSRRVYLFPDTFMNYYEPEIGVAAGRLLQAAGCKVRSGLAREGGGGHFLRCCGRPFISNGMLDEAVEHARHNIEILEPIARSGASIVACEPSCVLTIKDDYPALLRGACRARAEVVAGACRTFEECAEEALAGASDGGAHGLPFSPLRGRILVQAHCHQRSLVGTRALLSVLRRIPGAEVIDLDAGCCGMAGSFGYEREHYNISHLVGEQRLFPALRQAGADDVVVAPGFSCRLQIAHFPHRMAVHPATLLAGLCFDSAGGTGRRPESTLGRREKQKRVEGT
jgi:FAD/FMN-containing dehydrogenase/Fe-S oxidoreductase